MLPTVHRRGFLTRALAAVGAIALGRYAELAPAAMPTPVPPPAVPAAAAARMMQSLVYLDQGSLELGIIRDSLLLPREDWAVFGEVFENTAVVGRVDVAA